MKKGEAFPAYQQTVWLQSSGLAEGHSSKPNFRKTPATEI
jgi:hypothetical protein